MRRLLRKSYPWILFGLLGLLIALSPSILILIIELVSAKWEPPVEFVTLERDKPRVPFNARWEPTIVLPTETLLQQKKFRECITLCDKQIDNADNSHSIRIEFRYAKARALLGLGLKEEALLDNLLPLSQPIHGLGRCS